MKKSQSTTDHFVKIIIKKRREWLKVMMPKGACCQQMAKLNAITGDSLITGKKHLFHPSDVIAFYFGKLTDIEGLGMPYIPTADVCTILDTIVPDSMGYETHISCRIVQEKIGKQLHVYVAEKLNYTEIELCRSLSAEQVDAVALAIYNIEEKGQGMIIGDQTGIGKGRVAAVTNT